jgi:hypothetical protein
MIHRRKNVTFSAVPTALFLMNVLVVAVQGRNDDVFNYGYGDQVETGTQQQGVRSFGQTNWNSVSCDDRDTCVSCSQVQYCVDLDSLY